jgi:iron complex transport system permease protein
MNQYYSQRNQLFSFFIAKKVLFVLLMLFLMSIFIFIVGIGLGSTYLSPIEVIQSLLGNGSDDNNHIIYSLRLPRMIVAFMIGVALGIAGAILQGMVRNPLASPDIIGVTGGASFGAVLYLFLFSATIGVKYLPFAAISGALVVSLIIYLLAWKNGVSTIRLVLVGIGMATLMSSATSFMIVMSPSYTASDAYIWLTGSVYASSWDQVQTLIPWLAICIPIAIYFSKSLNVQELGDDIATSLGSSVQKERFILLLTSVVLVGAAASIAGAVSFVGLIAPHISRKLVGRLFGSLLPASALMGGIIVLLADIIARTAFQPYDVPCGVFTAAIGAPFFIYLLYRNRNN